MQAMHASTYYRCKIPLPRYRHAGNLQLPAVICGKYTSLVGKSPVTVSILYSKTNIRAGNLPLMSRSRPVIAGKYLQTGGAVRCW